ncbi:hypothetical protein [Saccharopolyspora hattusasensis]|uniref:hypothetical protein n=1 Tax=Saccharopolyspora hattusasensis TaxID=1128679 RepID=UPI003D97610A
MSPGADSVPTSGMRVRLRPTRRADIVDIALAGRLAEVEGVEHGADGRVYVIVSLLGDTAVDLGPMSQLGHRFFFSPEELELLPGGSARRVLVAGVGDIFSSGGGRAHRITEDLRRSDLPPGVRVANFGIRWQDLLRSLEDCDAAVLLCAGAAGEVRSIEIADLPGFAHSGAQLQPAVAHRCVRITSVGCGETGGAGLAGRALAIEAVMSVVDDLLADRAFEGGTVDER